MLIFWFEYHKLGPITHLDRLFHVVCAKYVFISKYPHLVHIYLYSILMKARAGSVKSENPLFQSMEAEGPGQWWYRRQ